MAGDAVQGQIFIDIAFYIFADILIKRIAGRLSGLELSVRQTVD